MKPTQEDRRAAFFVLLLFLAGVVVRVLAVGEGAAPGSVLLRPNLQSERANRDSVEAQAARLSEPLKRGERIDVDVAGELDLTRLPRIGPALARRIVEDREQNGPFGSLESLDRVSGVGPRLLEGLEPHVSFSGRLRRSSASPRPGNLISVNTATATQLAGLPGIGPTRAAAIVKHRQRHGRFSSLDGLTEVPGIGPATVDRIRAHVGLR